MRSTKCIRRMNKLLINIGLPKTGTTYLGSLFKKFEFVSVSSVKEPSFFIKRGVAKSSIVKKIIVRGNRQRGNDWYRSLYDQSCPILVDQSTQYWIDSESVIDAASENYDVYPFIICRSPMAQIKSYVAHLRRGYLPNKSLKDICRSDQEFKDYLVAMYDFSNACDRKRGVIEGVLYLDFDMLVSSPSKIYELISSYTGADLRMVSFEHLDPPTDSASKNERGHPRYFFLNAVLTSSFAKRIGALTPSFLYGSLIRIRKQLIRTNLKPGDSQWAHEDFEYLQALLGHEVK